MGQSIQTTNYWDSTRRNRIALQPLRNWTRRWKPGRRHRWFQLENSSNIYRIFTNFLQSFPETEKEEILLCSLREASVTLTPKPCRVQERQLEANIAQELRGRNSRQSASRPSKKDFKNIQYDQIATIYPSYMWINQYNYITYQQAKKDNSHSIIIN